MCIRDRYYLNKEIMRARILTEGIRPDGRGLTDVRPIWCEVGILPRTRGSAIFTRGGRGSSCGPPRRWRRGACCSGGCSA